METVALGVIVVTLTGFITFALGGKTTSTYLHGRDKRTKKPEESYQQDEKPKLILDKETGGFEIKFGEKKSLKNCQPRVKMEGKTYFRTVTGTGKAYQNVAISSFDVKKMAISNAWNLFFQSFGFYPDEIEKFETKTEEEQGEEPNDEPPYEAGDADRPDY